MGSIVQAKCSECGYNAMDLTIGGGMMNFTTFCGFPVCCNECHQVSSPNLLDDPIKCMECESTDVMPYDDARLRHGEGTRSVAGWHLEELGRDLELTDAHYYCPACGSFTLNFDHGPHILFD